MAYLPMTQEIIKFMNKEFDKDDIVTYQMLIVLFGTLFANEKEFLKDPGDRMGLSHFVENFLRTNDFQTVVTIDDLNLIFNNNADYDIHDIKLYKVFFTLIYEELASNDPQISIQIKNAIFHLTDLVDQYISEMGVDENKVQEQQNSPVEQDVFVEESYNNHFQPFLRDNTESFDQLNQDQQNTSEENVSNTFIIGNKKYLREYIKDKQLLPYECSICGLTEWQNEPLRLELDSLDGIYNNLNLKNLRFLCPNCYSQIGHFE